MTDAVAQQLTKIPDRGNLTRVGLALAAAVMFHIAFQVPVLNSLILLYAFFLIVLSRGGSHALAFRLGFLTGLCVFGPQLAWFWRIFGIASICLWAVLALFTGLFVLGLHSWRTRFGSKWLWVVAPVLWTGLEYFRSELYFLRFSWLSAGYVFSGHSGLLRVGYPGVYGCGFAIFFLAALCEALRQRRSRMLFLTGSVLTVALLGSIQPAADARAGGTPLQVAGIQLEFPPELKVPDYLDKALRAHPNAELFVLSEYTFEGEIPSRVRAWCRTHNKYLVAGGKKEAAESGQFYNTAFVVGPTGEIVFEQVKSVPIQFFKDGLPATHQKVWDSPWGKIAICVCYDMSYRAVIDRFVRQGAQALIVPFMDVTDWGAHQHALHARVSSLRAQEYRIPIFRLGSSGISQIVDSAGRVVATAPFPGQEEIIGGTIMLAAPGRLPLDAILAPACVFATILLVVLPTVQYFRSRRSG